MRPESKTHEEIKKKLKEIGWQECEGYKEHQLIEDYLLKNILRKKLREINHETLKSYALKDEHVEKLVETAVNKLMSIKDPVEILSLLKEGTLIELGRGRRGSISVRVQFFDFKKTDRNLFCFIHEAKFKGYPDNVKPDFTLFINGIPTVVIEAKREFSESEEETYREGLVQIERYEKDSPELFKYVQIGVVVADRDIYIPTYPNPERESRAGRKINLWMDENEREDIYSLIQPEVLLDVVENFTFFSVDRSGSVTKIIPRYKQFWAVNKAFKRIREYLEEGKEKDRGLVWHWQGAGKTFEILFLAEKFYRRYESRNPCVFIVVDRIDLENQFEKDINSLKSAKLLESFKRIESVRELKEVLRTLKESENSPSLAPTGVYLVMAHKFRIDVAKEIERIGEVRKKEVLILRDEAHRTEGGKGVFASVRKFVMPRALKFGFTGTPVHKQENNTFKEYAYPEEGELYLDKYFIEQSIKDGYTLPLLWRVAVSEGVSLNLSEEEVKQLIRRYFVDRNLEGEVPEISEREIKEKLPFSDLLTADDFIEKASRYIAQKVKEDTEGFRFKAMVIAQDRESAVKFKHYLDKFLPEFIGDYSPEWTQVVITHGHNDPDIIRSFRMEMEGIYGKNIERLNKEWTENFVDRELPKILVVNRKLLTGFDAPNLKVIYIAQLMKDVLLLQACARANRPYPGKSHGLIVDLCGVLIENYRKAIEEYKIYEDEQINKDILKNLFMDTKELWESFLQKFEDFIELFGEITGVEWEDYLRILSEGSSEEAKELFADVVSKIVTSEKGLFGLYPRLRELIKIYEVIGAYPDKVRYQNIYRELLVLSAGIGRKLKPRIYIPNELKRELLKRLEFEEIKEIDKLELDEETIEKFRRTGKLYVVVADFLFPLLVFLEDKKDPLHKAIYRRLQELKEQYLSRQTTAETLIENIKNSLEELKSYEALRKRATPEELIVKNIKFYLKAQGAKLLETEGLKGILRDFLTKKLITEDMKARLKEELIISLEVEEEKLEKIVDLITEEIVIPMVRELKHEGKA